MKKIAKSLFIAFTAAIILTMAASIAEAGQLRLNKKDVNVYKNKSVTVKAKGLSKKKLKKVKWTFSDKSCVKVLKKRNGSITFKAKKTGITVLRAKYKKQTAYCLVVAQFGCNTYNAKTAEWLLVPDLIGTRVENIIDEPRTEVTTQTTTTDQAAQATTAQENQAAQTTPTTPSGDVTKIIYMTTSFTLSLSKSFNQNLSEKMFYYEPIIFPEESEATKEDLTFTSSDTSVATVDKHGYAHLTGKTGTFTLTATADSGVFASYTATVTE